MPNRNKGALPRALTPGNTNTRFNSYFDTQITRLLAVGDADTAYKYVQKAVPVDKANIVIVIVNDSTYGGSGGALSVTSTNDDSKYIMVHEIGHSFGGLADEYTDDVEASIFPLDFVGFFPNVDTTNNPLKIKWAHFLTQSAYNGIVGAFEGGYYRAPGVYGPEEGSVMYDLGHLNYNAPSREAIVRHIDQILNVPFDFYAFLKADSSSLQPVLAGSVVAGPVNLLPPRNDFINMRERILLLRKNKKQ